MIGEQIRIARKHKGFNQSDFADKIGLSRATIVNIEKGRHNINQIQIEKIIKVLEVDANFLFKTSEKKYEPILISTKLKILNLKKLMSKINTKTNVLLENKKEIELVIEKYLDAKEEIGESLKIL